jgi:hypothetical protein
MERVKRQLNQMKEALIFNWQAEEKGDARGLVVLSPDTAPVSFHNMFSDS